MLKHLCRLREQVLRELGFMDIFKKVKVNMRFNIMYFSVQKFFGQYALTGSFA